MLPWYNHMPFPLQYELIKYKLTHTIFSAGPSSTTSRPRPSLYTALLWCTVYSTRLDSAQLNTDQTHLRIVQIEQWENVFSAYLWRIIRSSFAPRSSRTAARRCNSQCRLPALPWCSVCLSSSPRSASTASACTPLFTKQGEKGCVNDMCHQVSCYVVDVGFIILLTIIWD